MPSHRADTPADTPTALDTRPSTHAPLQRRRDLRSRGASSATGRGTTATAHRPAPHGRLDWLEASTAHVPGQRELSTPPAGVPSLDAAAGLGGRRRESARLQAARDHAATNLAVTNLAVTNLAGTARRVPAVEPSSLFEPAGRAGGDAPATTRSADVPTFGALALDPLFLTRPESEPDDDEVAGSGPPAPVQPLRRPRGKERAELQTTRRALRQAGAKGGPKPEQAARRGATSALPQVGIAGALGLVTIAVPLCSAFGVVPAAQSATGSKGAPNAAAAAALTPLPPFPMVAAPPLNALADRRLLPDETPVAEVPAALAAPRVRLITDGRASRGKARAVLPGCDGKVPDVTGIQNGRLPASMLCTLWDKDQQLRADAAVAIAKLNIAYTKRFGHPICFNDAYRSLSEQYQIKARRGGYAARPGTSEHGWGLAVDLCDGVDQGPSSATYSWLRANAPAYGWENPLWARGGGGPYEPWHWEYMPGKQGQAQGD